MKPFFRVRSYVPFRKEKEKERHRMRTRTNRDGDNGQDDENERGNDDERDEKIGRFRDTREELKKLSF